MDLNAISQTSRLPSILKLITVALEHEVSVNLSKGGILHFDFQGACLAFFHMITHFDDSKPILLHEKQSVIEMFSLSRPHRCHLNAAQLKTQ